MKTINKSELADILLANPKNGLQTKAQSKRVIENLAETIIQFVTDGDEVRIGELGTFSALVLSARKGEINGHSYDTPERKTLKFSASAGLKRRLNGGVDDDGDDE
jgi:nucleoid DNA-binding protein